ncbi:MAG TPA: hypothetical protein VFD36_02050, partial [Kofleriaceae bacterium]|nr:hypothetical protein [Kofleriaceae bacterium]
MNVSAIAILLSAAAGCAAGAAGDAPDDELPTGQLVLQLVQPGPHGEIFHLNNAIFDVTSATGAVTTVDGSGLQAQVTLSLPPGIATVVLRDGWTLEKSVNGGVTFTPVGALLGSLNPSAVRVLANQPVFVGFDFLVRDSNGTLAITLGIVAAPRELAGGFIVNTATDGFTDYALPANRLMDFAVFFNLSSLESVTLGDGTRQRTYTAFGQQGSLGPIPLPTQAVAAEIYNDHLGTLSGPIAAELAAGFLQYTVAARPDGSIELSGTLAGGSTEIDFGPNAIDAIPPTLDADGFPNDEFF